MELGSYQVTFCVYATEWDSIFGSTCDCIRIFWIGVIAVDEIEVTVLRYSVKQRVLDLEVDAVPSHVRNFLP